MQHVRLRFDVSRNRQKHEITLGGVPIRIWAYPSQLTDRWYITIHDLEDSLLAGPIVCVPGVDLLRPYKHLPIPQGALFAYATNGEPPTFDTLDTAARVLYV